MKIIQQEIKGKTRKLTADWKLDIGDIGSANDILVKKLTEEIQKEIDFEILTGMLLEFGWTEINFTPSGRYFEIDAWCEENTAGVQGYGSRWLFKDEKDITMFILRWSSD
jgi:hypothetical protein